MAHHKSSVKKNSVLTGLSNEQVAQRLLEEGTNDLGLSQRRTLLVVMRDVLFEPMFLLLLAAGAIYLLTGERNEAMVLLGFVLVIMGMTVFQERRTDNALAALRDLSSPRALVIRSGVEQRIAGHEVVREDVLILAEGDRVPADGTLLQAHELSLDETMLSFKQRMGIAPFRLHAARLRIQPSLHTYREDFYQTLAVSMWAQGGELIYASPIEDEALADGLRRLSAAFGVGVTSFGLTADALDELPRPANILNAHPRETEAIMAKLEINRIAAAKSRAQLDWNELSSLRNESEEAEKLVRWLTRCIDERKAEGYREE